MTKHGLEVSEEINIQMEEHEGKGETVILVCLNGRHFKYSMQYN